MIKNSKSRAKNMSMEERWRRYEQDKQELLCRSKDMTLDEINDAYAAIREKWRV